MAKSVHLESFPNEETLPYDQQLIEQIEIVRGICNAALSIRNECSIKVKTPLSLITVYSKDPLNIEEFSPTILDEINAHAINYSLGVENISKPRAVLNLKTCGSKLGSRTKEVMEAVNSGKWEISDSGKLIVAQTELEPEDFKMQFDLLQDNSGHTKYAPVQFGIFSKVKKQIFVALNTEITKQMEELGLVREIVRCIQQTRKALNLSLGQFVQTEIITNSGQIASAINNQSHKAYISSNTLSEIQKTEVQGGMEESGHLNLHIYEIESIGQIGVKISTK